MEILGEIVGILVGGIQGIATGVGQGLQTLVSSIFLDSATGGLSVFGTLVVVFAGVALAIGLCRLIFMWCQSLGK